MNCQLCSESNVPSDHHTTERHMKNKTLFDYSVYKKLNVGNKKGIIVSCDVRSSSSTHSQCYESKINVSVKPNEQVEFTFTILNDTKKDKFSINCAQIMHSKLNFTINDHGIDAGSPPHIIKPKSKLNKKITVMFRSASVGEYVMPIVFCFIMNSTNENIVIVRDMVVYVEKQKKLHDKMYSPFVLQSIVAEKTYRCVREGTREEGIFTVPKNYKPIYSSALKCPSNLTQEKAKLVADLRKIFSTGITKMNYVQFFHHLLWYEETVLKNNLKNYNMTGVNLKLGSIPSSYTLVVPGLAEKRPSLLVGDYLFVKPQNEKIMFEANVTLITENDVTIQGMHSTFCKNYSKTKKYDIRFTMSRVTLERMHQAVHFAEQQMPRLFPTHYTNKKKVEPITEFFNVNIRDNLEQRSAVEHIVSGSSERAPYLVHGPPGTGKTVTIVEAILQLVVRNSKNRILVCTDSNMAADNVATMLIKYAKKFPSEKFLLRASSFYRTWATLPECLHAFSNGTSTKDFWSVSFTAFQKYAIVITTLSHAAKFSGSFSKNRTCHITHLFIDEAAQASEPASLIPICGLLSTAGSLVLAGDPLQLGPVIISQKAKEIGLGLSLMERLMKTFPQYNDVKNDCNYIMLLRNNFRSDPDILHIPNELFYKGQLRAHASEDPISKTDLSGEKPSSRAIMFHGVLSKEQKVGMSPSFYNNSELEIVQMYITFLVNDHRIQLEDIGVITPYIRQAYHIKKWLSSNNYEKIEVGTVESFQGKEKRVIVVSTVRANNDLLAHDAKFQLGFLVDDKRFNVALTRAKAKLIIIGNPLCLRKDKKWQLYMQMCRELGTYFGFDSDNIETDELDRKVDEILPLFRHIEVSKQE